MSKPTVANTWIALLRAQQAMDKVARASMDAVGLGYSDFTLLEALLHLGPLMPSQLAQKISLTRGSVTSAIDRLVQRNLVQRQFHDEDGRCLLVHLTNQGRRIIEPAYLQHKRDLERVLGGALSANDRRLFFRLLMQVRDAAHKEFSHVEKD